MLVISSKAQKIKLQFRKLRKTCPRSSYNGNSEKFRNPGPHGLDGKHGFSANQYALKITQAPNVVQ